MEVATWAAFLYQFKFDLQGDNTCIYSAMGSQCASFNPKKTLQMV